MTSRSPAPLVRARREETSTDAIGFRDARARDQDFLRLYYKSVKHAWSLEEIVSRDATFDFTLPFMPDPVTPAAQQARIDPRVRLTLSQLRGNEYFSIIVFIEDVIVDFLWDYVGRQRFTLPLETQQALTNFISEEMKHTLMFQAFRRKFEQGFGSPCRAMTRTADFVQFVLKHDPLGVLLFILHGEAMTFIHYLSSIDKTGERQDPYFADLLKFHWIEEAGHVTLDELLLQEMARPYSDARKLTAIRDYFALVDFLDGALMRVGHFDLLDLCAAPGLREPVMDARADLVRQQRRFYTQSYILDVMESPRFRKAFAALSPDALPLLDEKIGVLKGVLV